jgi:hypothetical protein
VFRYHPCFRLPVEKSVNPDEITYWPCENGLIITSPTGVILVLIRVPGKVFPIAWFDYPDRLEAETFLFESDIRERMLPDERDKEISLEIISAGGGTVKIDWHRIISEGKTGIPEERNAVFRSRAVSMSRGLDIANSGDLVFKHRYMASKLTCLRTFRPLTFGANYRRDIACAGIVFD